MNVFDSVHHFHEKFGMRVHDKPEFLNPHLYEVRVKFMMEELSEYIKECEDGNMPGALDGLIDLLYVVVGTIDLHGFTPEQATEAFRRVHAANMAKVKVRHEGESKRGTLWDVKKPKDWQPPVLDDLCKKD